MSTIDRAEIKFKAKSILRGNWPICVGVTLVYLLFVFLAEYFVSFLGTLGLSLSIIITPLLLLPLMSFFINSVKAKFFSLEHMKINFKTYFKTLLFIILTSFCIIPYLFLFTIFTSTSNFFFLILSIISIVFFIYISLAFFAVPFILIESNGEKEIFTSIKESYNLTKGYVLNLFIFNLSFLGWQILCFFTFGIGFLWLIPYIHVSQYLYYRKLYSLKFSEINSLKIN